VKKSATAAIFLLAAALYLPTIGLGFTGWDDTGYVTRNPLVTSAAGFSRIFTSSESDVYYPLTYASYWLEYRLWGGRPAGYHAVNVLLHGANAALLFHLLLALGTSLRGAGLGATLFAVHPLQVMTVAWIAERKNLLALLFTLLCLMAWVAGRRALALLAFAAALASKTVVLGLPLVLLLYDFLVRKPSARVALRWVAPMLLASLAFALTTIAFEQPFVDRASGLTPGPLERLQIAGAAPWFYLAKLALPVGLSPAYPRWRVDAGSVLWWLPLLVTLAALAGFVVLLPRVRSLAGLHAAWLLALAAILLVPSLGIVAFANLSVSSVSDHFLYLPSAGIFGAVGSALDGSRRLGRALLAGTVAFCLACAALTLAYQPVFRDAASLWSRVLTLDPDSYAGNLGLAEAEAEAGRFADALPRYARAMAVEPLAADAYLLLGQRKNEMGDAAGAAALFVRALELSPVSVPAMVGLAAAHEQLGSAPEALAAYERAARLAPRDVPARMGLGRMYLGFARPADALREFLAVLAIVPAHPRASLGAATSLRSLGRYQEAVGALRGELERSPNDVALVHLLALTLATAPDHRVRRGTESVALAERALVLGPAESHELRATLAAAYAEAGRFDEALREARRAEAAASAAGDEGSAAEQRRRAELYARGEALRLGR
jgi:tetratricopeptide (TPR) repeat protein